MLAALCLNIVLYIIMPLYELYTMYSILKRRQCKILTLSKSNQESHLQLMHCLVILQTYIVYIQQSNCIQALQIFFKSASIFSNSNSCVKTHFHYNMHSCIVWQHLKTITFHSPHFLALNSPQKFSFSVRVNIACIAQ